MTYDGLKAFYVVSDMIAVLEDELEVKQAYIVKNNGFSHLKPVLVDNKIRIQQIRKELKPLYRVRNALYGVV